jgi:hypothetical protein
VLERTVLAALLLRPFRCKQCSARHVAFFFRRRLKTAHRVVADPIKE